MKLFQFLKNKRKAKEIDKLILQTPYLNKVCRKYGYPDWQTAAIALRTHTPEEIKAINTSIILRGREKNGCKPLFWTAEDWQNHITGENGC